MICFKEKKVIIWDWNGTILNDTNYCVNCMNILLKQRNIPTININQYKEIFTFPVEKYYQSLGFDFNKEDFSIPAMEFINYYLKDLDSVDIFPDSTYILEHFKNLGFEQYILSAMEHDSLIKTLTQRNLIKYFTDISGLGDHYARSKTESGNKLIEKIGYDKKYFTMIGDTIHDLEVANNLGIDCILISNGHQSKQRLLKKTQNVINSLSELKEHRN